MNATVQFKVYDKVTRSLLSTIETSSRKAKRVKRDIISSPEWKKIYPLALVFPETRL